MGIIQAFRVTVELAICLLVRSFASTEWVTQRMHGHSSTTRGEDRRFTASEVARITMESDKMAWTKSPGVNQPFVRPTVYSTSSPWGTGPPVIVTGRITPF